MKNRILAVLIDGAIFAGMYYAMQGNPYALNAVPFVLWMIGAFGLLMLLVSLAPPSYDEQLAAIFKTEAGAIWTTYDWLTDASMMCAAAAFGWYFAATCVAVYIFGKAALRSASTNAKKRIAEKAEVVK